MAEDFDLEQYLGTWYEQGSTPMRFSKGCKNSIAEYSLVKKGVVKVLNSCERRGGVDTAEGRGYASNEPRKLRVGFFPRSFPIFRADYNIRYIDDDYSEAIVTSGMNSVWILTRRENVGKREYQRLLEKAKDLGIDVSKVERTRIDKLIGNMEDIFPQIPKQWRDEVAEMDCQIVKKSGKHGQPSRMLVCKKDTRSIIIPLEEK